MLDLNWRIAEERAAEHGQVGDRSGLRLVAPFHIAESRDQALAEVQQGGAAAKAIAEHFAAAGPAGP